MEIQGESSIETWNYWIKSAPHHRNWELVFIVQILPNPTGALPDTNQLGLKAKWAL
jgi:hypothetical protein